VFYTITGLFAGYITFFTFIVYPNPEAFHPSQELIENLALNYPRLKWFLRLGGKWSYVSFYTIAELWGSMMLTLLFWQFANQITKTSEAKRFYSMYGMLGNFGLIATGLLLEDILSDKGSGIASFILSIPGLSSIVSTEQKFTPIFLITVLSSLMIMYLYYWINNYVLTDPTLYEAGGAKAKKSKVKLSLIGSFKMIMSSKYLGLIAILIIAYGISMNIVEGVWKAKIRELYPTAESYTIFMGNFQKYQGMAAILFMLIGSNILRTLSWRAAAMFTPAMILVTGLMFFGFIFFDNIFTLYLTGIMTSGPLAAAVLIGTIQNVASKATKYSLFDSTKEMSYIPLDDELKSKGKAAVDVIGGRFGKSGGGFIQSTFFMLFPGFTFVEATPYFAGIFFVIVVLWLYAVNALSKEYNRAIETQNQ
jgi:AAA family ATP:ADP antiporter